MTRTVSRAWWRVALAATWMLHLPLVAFSVALGARFQSLPIPRYSAVLVVVVVYSVATGLLLRSHSVRVRALRVAAQCCASAITVRFWVPIVVLAPAMREADSRAVAVLRELAMRQEQARLTEGAYVDSGALLGPVDSLLRVGALSLEVEADSGWSAHLRLEAADCRIAVRSIAWRIVGVADGVPVCAREVARRGAQAVRAVPPVRTNAHPFPLTAIFGESPQHRVDAERTGVSPNVLHAQAWVARVSGELRASVSVAGDQVFVGAHGNGELVALRRSDGSLGWRVRMPNWIHHEPAVGSTVIAVGFGNNESVRDWNGFLFSQSFGSPPSGVAVIDRATGRIRWIRFTSASRMGAPILADGRVISLGADGRLIAWRVEDGERLWVSPASLDGVAPMTNPVLVDSMVITSAEPGALCAFAARDGRRIYCRANPRVGAGYGHSSPSVHDGWVVQSGVAAPRGAIGVTRVVAYRLIGIPIPLMTLPEGEPQTAIVSASDLRTGAERWTAFITGTSRAVFGHVAGTPTFAGDTVVVPLPTVGAVVALRIRDGGLLWRADVGPARGSVTLSKALVLAATADRRFVSIDIATGRVVCEMALPSQSDRAGLTVSGGFGILALIDGTVIGAPMADWEACRALVR